MTQLHRGMHALPPNPSPLSLLARLCPATICPLMAHEVQVPPPHSPCWFLQALRLHLRTLCSLPRNHHIHRQTDTLVRGLAP